MRIAPAVLDSFGTPSSPADLASHRCLGVRLGNDTVYDWEFRESEGEFSIPVASRIVADDTRATLAMARAGTGLMYGPEPIFGPDFAAGSLVLVLETWAVTGAGCHVYHPSRRQMPTGLRVLIDLVRELRPLGL